MSAAEQPELRQLAASRGRHQARQRSAACRGFPVHPDRQDDGLRDPHGLPAHRDGLTEALQLQEVSLLQEALPMVQEWPPAVWPLPVVWPLQEA